MNYKILNRVFAGMAFLLASVVYLMTVQPTVPFWDCGEFSSAAIWQQVPHPPGAPLFLMIGKMFHLLIPFGDPAWRLNLAAVFSSAVTIFLLYLITVKVIENLASVKKYESLGQAIAVFGSAFVAAAAYTFSETFWFNAVESEVYATSSLFATVVIYLMMLWNEKANEEGNEKYLILMFYIIGLSLGVHLLAVLTVFSIVMVVYFKKYEFNIVSFLMMGAVAVGIFFIIYPFIVKYIPAFLAGHSANRNEAREYPIEDSTALFVIAIAVIILALVGMWYAYKHKMPILNLICTSFIFVLLGYTTYTQILLRSNANPPMNENEPKDFSSLSSYIGREQYGNAPTFPRRYQSEGYFIDMYNKKNEKGEYVYGKWTAPKTKPVTRKDGQRISVEDWDNTEVNVMGELTYMWKYQMNHMYWRYFGWNFIGKASDFQDLSVVAYPGTTKNDVADLNYGSGYADHFPIKYYALPFIFGLIGLLFHFYRDRKMAFVYLILFLLTGVLMALSQNQQEPQPRERDYFYAVSFMIWAMWIGLGTYGIIESLNKEKIKQMTAALVLAVTIILVPVNMAVGGWFTSSRAGNFIPFDYSYNILQSTEKNAILFTNGDNDTFPVWYLQDVVGVRRDVRVVNLSLGNTLWYVHQLKHREPWGAEKIPLTFSDASLTADEMSEIALSYDFGEARNVRIPVRREIMERFTNDSAKLANPAFEFVFEGKPYGNVQGRDMYVLRVQDKLILDILENVRFERPVYFSNTVGPDAFAGLEPFFRLEGMAMRICPVRQNTEGMEAMDIEIMEKCLMEYDNSEYFSKTPKYGFKFRNLNNPEIYYDEVHRRLMGTYRNLFIAYATTMYLQYDDKEKAAEIMNEMNKVISVDQFPIPFEQLFRISKLYDDFGDAEQSRDFAERTVESVDYLINNPDVQPQMIQREILGRYMGPYRYKAFALEVLGRYDDAILSLEQLIAISQTYLDQMSNEQSNETYQRIRYSILDLRSQIVEMNISKLKDEEGNEAALEYAKSKITEFRNDPELRFFTEYIMNKIDEIQSDMRTDTISELQ